LNTTNIFYYIYGIPRVLIFHITDAVMYKSTRNFK